MRRIQVMFLSIAMMLTLQSLGARAASAEMIPPAVAVLYFDYTGQNEQLAVLKKGLAQMLISDLETLADNCVIVERDRLEEILKELKLSNSKKVDPKTAAKVGKLIGARYIVMGNFFDLFGTLRIDSRLVDVETSAIVGAVKGQGKLDDFFDIQKKLATDLGLALKENAKPIEYNPKKHKRRKKRRARKAVRATPKAKKVVKLKKATVLEYSKALDAKDRGDKETATKLLKKVVAEQPDFALATMDLNSLVQ